MTTNHIEGSDIDVFRIRTLHKALRLEIQGMSRKGRSAYSILKQELGLKGSRQSVYDQVAKLLEGANDE